MVIMDKLLQKTEKINKSKTLTQSITSSPFSSCLYTVINDKIFSSSQPIKQQKFPPSDWFLLILQMYLKSYFQCKISHKITKSWLLPPLSSLGRFTDKTCFSAIITFVIWPEHFKCGLRFHLCLSPEPTMCLVYELHQLFDE